MLELTRVTAHGKHKGTLAKREAARLVCQHVGSKISDCSLAYVPTSEPMTSLASEHDPSVALPAHAAFELLPFPPGMKCYIANGDTAYSNAKRFGPFVGDSATLKQGRTHTPSAYRKAIRAWVNVALPGLLFGWIVRESTSDVQVIAWRVSTVVVHASRYDYVLVAKYTRAVTSCTERDRIQRKARPPSQACDQRS